MGVVSRRRRQQPSRASRSPVWVTIWAACAMTLGACNGNAMSSVHAYPISGEFFGIAAMSDGTVVVGHEPDLSAPTALLRIDLATGEASSVDLDATAPCDSPDVFRPSRLPDGRLGALVSCPVSGDSVVVAIDVTDGGGTEVLAELSSVPGHLAWNPELDRALADFGSDICGSLAWVSDRGELSPMELTVEAAGRSFSLGDAYRGMRGGDCRDDGRAAWPSWSVDDKLAFFASPQSIGADGSARLAIPWSLFIADPDEDFATAVVHDVSSPRSLSWSPDGSRLAFARVPSAGSGTWLVDPQGTLTQVSDVSLEWLSWDPSGTALIGLWRSGGPESAELEIVRINLASEITNP